MRSRRHFFFLAVALCVGWLAARPAVAQAQVPVLFAFEEAISGNDETRLRWPTAVATSGGEEIAVTDADGPRLILFRDQGGGNGWMVRRTIDLPAPAYDLSCGTDRYLVSTREPGSLLAIDRRDFSLRRLELPTRLTPGAVTCLPDGELVVHDLAAGELVILDRDLTVRSSTAASEAITDLAPGPGGGFYAALPGRAEIHRYGANGDHLGVIDVPGVGPTPAWPVGVLVAETGELVIVDRHGGRIQVLEASGRWAGTGSRRGWEPGLIRSPAGLARLSDGRVVVADQGNGRLQLFRRLEP